MTNILHEYPEYAGLPVKPATTEDMHEAIQKKVSLVHYKAMALHAVTEVMAGKSNRQLVDHCLEFADEGSLVLELAQRFNEVLKRGDI
jgi:hypothetical protein